MFVTSRPRWVPTRAQRLSPRTWKNHYLVAICRRSLPHLPLDSKYSWAFDISSFLFLNIAIQCPREEGNCFEYTACETACPKTCDNLCDVTPARCPVRFEGCSCPNGTVLHNGKCIAPGNCPCHLGGVDYKPGSIVVQNCQRW